MRYTGLSGQSYQLSSNYIASGGEGNVFRVTGSHGKKVAKIYHANKLTQELENKLKYMVNNPPDQSVLDQVAWPLDVLYDTNKKFCGFVMPELNVTAELREIYQYPPTAGLSNKEKVIIAWNICFVISAVHNAGYVFGDFNPRNIGVDKNTGKIAFFDTDTYHFSDTAANKHYRCKVCADGYAAPELLEACANHAANYPHDSQSLYEKTPLPTFTKETDNFALAIHIFKLLMNGFTPFGGIIETVSPSQASPSMGNAAVRRNEYSFRPGYKPLSLAVPPLDILPQEIADLFTRAFLVIGTVNPSQRPTSNEWQQALECYEAVLVDCPSNSLHQYDRKNNKCPYCEADKKFQQTQNKTKRNQQRTYTQTSSPRRLPKIPSPPYTSPPTPPPKSGISYGKVFFVALVIVGIIIWANTNRDRPTSPQRQPQVAQPAPQRPAAPSSLHISGVEIIDAGTSGTRFVNRNNYAVRVRVFSYRDGRRVMSFMPSEIRPNREFLSRLIDFHSIQTGYLNIEVRRIW